MRVWAGSENKFYGPRSLLEDEDMSSLIGILEEHGLRTRRKPFINH